jgi:hypothetical protein
MALSPASIDVGKCYVRFTEVRRVTKVTASGEVEYVSQMKTETNFGWSTSLNRLNIAQFAMEVEREVPCHDKGR